MFQKQLYEQITLASQNRLFKSLVARSQNMIKPQHCLKIALRQTREELFFYIY